MDGYMMVECEYENGEMWRVKQSLEYYDDEYLPPIGEFGEEANNPGCPAFGKVEAMAQDDNYSNMIRNTFPEKIKRMKIWQVG